MADQIRGDDAADHARAPADTEVAKQKGKSPPALDAKQEIKSAGANPAAKTIPAGELDSSNDE